MKCRIQRLLFVTISFILTVVSLILLIINYNPDYFLSITLLFLALAVELLFSLYIYAKNLNTVTVKPEKKLDNNYELLYDLFKEISNEQNIRLIYDKLLRYALKAVSHANFGSVLVNDGTNNFTFAAMTGNDLEKFKNFTLSMDELSLNTASNGKSSKAIVVENILEGNKNRFDSATKSEIFSGAAISDIRYTMSVPIYIEDELKVVLNLDTDEDRIFTEEDKRYLEVFASAATPFIKLDDALSNLEYLGNHDKLTGMNNRQYFDKMINESYVSKKGNKVILIDIDEFKQINDIYGHSIGDQCLSIFSRLLVIKFPNSIAARYGGDEFNIYCTDISNEEIKKRFDIITKNCRLIIKNGKNVNFTFSYGVSECTGKESFQDLYRKADELMYETKRSKKKN